MSRVEQLHKLLAAEPDDAEVYYMLAMEYKSTGQFEQALAKFDDCIRLNPSYAPAYFQKGNTCAAAGQVEQARRALALGIDKARQAGDLHAAEEMQAAMNALL